MLAITLIVLTSAPVCAAQDVPSKADRELTEALRDEIRLARFNLYYRLESAKQGRWKGLRYFTFQEANAALTEAGLIVGVSERMSHIRGNRFQHLNVETLETGNVLGGIGQTLGAAGSALEFAINGYHTWNANRRGFDATTAIRRATTLSGSIINRLTRAEAFIEVESGSQKQIHSLEHRILSDVHDLLIAEFNGFHIRARRTIWFQQSFYLLDIAKNSIGAAGNIYGYKALHRHNRSFNKPAGVLILTSGAFIIGAPIVSRGVGLLGAALDRRRLNRSGLLQPGTAIARLESDIASLRATMESLHPHERPVTAINRAAIYESHLDRFTRQLEIGTREMQVGNRIAVENILSGMLVGGSKLANGVEFTQAGYQFHNNAKMTNILIGTGSIPYLAGSGYALLDNARIQVAREIDYRRLRRRGRLPAQLINAQLEQLSTIEKSLDAMQTTKRGAGRHLTRLSGFQCQ